MELPKCDKCNKAVQIREGILTINLKEVREIQDAQEAWKSKHSTPLTSSIDILTFPDRAKWKWGHHKCFRESSYPIEATRLDTVEKVLHWTFHLMGKNWFMTTDWRNAIQRFYPKVWSY